MRYRTCSTYVPAVSFPIHVNVYQALDRPVPTNLTSRTSTSDPVQSRKSNALLFLGLGLLVRSLNRCRFALLSQPLLALACPDCILRCILRVSALAHTPRSVEWIPLAPRPIARLTSALTRSFAFLLGFFFSSRFSAATMRARSFSRFWSATASFEAVTLSMRLSSPAWG